MPLGEAYICQLATVTTPLHIGLGWLTLYIYNYQVPENFWVCNSQDWFILVYIVNETELGIIPTGHLLASEKLFFIVSLILANS